MVSIQTPNRRLMCISGTNEPQTFMEVEERMEEPELPLPFFEVPYQCFLTACPLLFHSLESLVSHLEMCHSEYSEFMSIAQGAPSSSASASGSGSESGSGSSLGNDSISSISPLFPWLMSPCPEPWFSPSDLREEEVWNSELAPRMPETPVSTSAATSTATPESNNLDLDTTVEDETYPVIKCEVEDLSDYVNDEMAECCDEDLILPDISVDDLRQSRRPWASTASSPFFYPRREDPERLKHITLGYILKSSPGVPVKQVKEKGRKSGTDRGAKGKRTRSSTAQNKKVGGCRANKRKQSLKEANLNQSLSEVRVVEVEEEKEVCVSQLPSVPLVFHLLDQNQKPVNVFEVKAVISPTEGNQTSISTIVDLDPITISPSSSFQNVPAHDQLAVPSQIEFSQEPQEDKRKSKKTGKPIVPKGEHWAYKHVVKKAVRRYMPRRGCPDELEMRLLCPVPGCDAHYRNPNGLKYHATHFHKHYKFF